MAEIKQKVRDFKVGTIEEVGQYPMIEKPAELTRRDGGVKEFGEK